MQHIPKLVTPGDPPRLGDTTLAEGVGVPLSFGHAYITLLVCLSGSAAFAFNFKDQAVRRGDVMVLARTRSRCSNVAHAVSGYFFA